VEETNGSKIEETKLMRAYDTDKTELLNSILSAKDMGLNLFTSTKMCLKKSIIWTT
jgi:hypothetical protein